MSRLSEKRDVQSTVRLRLFGILNRQVPQSAGRGVVGEEPAPMQAKAKRAAVLKTIVDALLRMNKVVAE